MPKSTTAYHLMAIAVVIVWGITFVSTKILLYNGLSPAEIMLYRFLLAYVCIWFISPRKLFADNFTDELKLMFAGIGGGSLYFLTENYALRYTNASNVSLIICTAPVLTALLLHISGKGKGERIGGKFILGALLALTGIALVVFNGSFVLRLNPLGDILTLIAALSWAVYTLIIRSMDSKYPTVFITRKVFFYGILTLLPVFIFTPLNFDLQTILKPVVVGNILFLGLIASMLCYIVWNVALKHLGGIRTSNYIFLIPVVTMSASAIIIDEKITWLAVLGGIFVLIGVYVADRSERKRVDKTVIK